MEGTLSNGEAEYTAHLRTRGIAAEALSLDEDGTVRSPSARAQAFEPVEAALPVMSLEAADGELRLLRTLGVGGMGQVMLAVQRPLQREVAVKLPRAEVVTPALTAELLREALVTGRLEHPNIVPVHLLGRSPAGAPFFVMKRIEGTPWRALLDDADALAKLGPPAGDALGLHLGVLREVCHAVSFAHSRGVLHRDLKPDNVMLGQFGEVYVLDWGIAVATRPDPLLSQAVDSRGICGTPAYMAPEMAAGDGARLSERTDVFLLGALLHHVLAGRPPYVGPTMLAVLTQAWEAEPPTFPASAPAELVTICQRAMARDPAARFESAQALRDALEGFLRRRGSLALAEEAHARLATVEAALSRRRAGEAVDAVALQVTFTECRFGFQQVRAVPGLEAPATAGLERALTAMAHLEVLEGNLAAARSWAAQLAVVPGELAQALDALAARVQASAARVQALERLESETDLDRAVALRSRVALAVSVGCSVAMLAVAVLKRLGLMPFGFREALVGMSLFAVGLGLVEAFIRRRTALNEAQRRLLNGNRVALVSFLVYWAGTWALGLPFETAAVGFDLHVAVNWWVATVLFDRRGWPVAAAFSVAALAAAVFTGWQFEVFALATFVGFGGLGLAWRGASTPR